MTADELLNLAQDGQAADFRDAVKELLTDRAHETILQIAENYDPLEDNEENHEDGDEIDLLDDEDVHLDDLDEEDVFEQLSAEFSDEDLSNICDNMTEEEFESLDDLSKAFLADFVARTTTEE